MSARPALANPLLAWHAAHRRDLPWRASLDARPAAYAVLVSEFMCQQTRVETVIPYFHRWMAALPDLRSLAAASEDDVVRLWTGLGYYRRARNLRGAALEAVRRHGQLPHDEPSLRALPGIGPYTAGAIASIAFGQRVPLVDGNVARVLARLHAIEVDVAASAGRRRAWSVAAEHVAALPASASPGHWNEALMELGATVCTPRSPSCAVCPIAADCAAFAAGRVDELPVPRKRAKVVDVSASYAVVIHADAVLVAQRPASGRWARLWEPPGFEGHDAADQRDAWLDANALVPMTTVGPLVHVLSHRRYRASADVVHLDSRRSATWLNGAIAGLSHVKGRWLAIEEALGKTSGLSRLGQRLVEAAVESGSDSVSNRPGGAAAR